MNSGFIFGILVHVIGSSWSKVLLEHNPFVGIFKHRHIDEADAVLVMYDLTSFETLHCARQLIDSKDVFI